MNAGASQRQEYRPQPRMIPEQIVAGEILQLPLAELEQRITAEFQQNPALTLEEVGLCPACGAPVSRFPCPSCGHRADPEDDVPVVLSEDWETWRQHLHDTEGLEPFGAVASRRTLRDELRAQWSLVNAGSDAPVGFYFIECLDEDGYMREDMLEVAQRFRLSVPQAEAVLARVQGLEPAGIAARNLKECLLLQCDRLAGTGPEPVLAARLIREAWDMLETRRTDLISSALGVPEQEAAEALDWIRDNLAPGPGRAVREAWDHLAPRDEPEVAPDVAIRIEGDGFVVEIVETSRFRIGLDPLYRGLDERVRRLGSGGADAEHIRRTTSSARWLIDAIAQRRRTLHLSLIHI